MRIVPRFVGSAAVHGTGSHGARWFFRGATKEAETPSILDFLIRFLSSRMRFKRNGSYTLNR